MPDMIAQTIEDFAKDLAKRRMVNDPPPVLLLGAGASAAAGVTLMKHLLPAFDCATPEEFFKEVGPLSPRERFRQLFEHLQTKDPFRLTSGYQALGALVWALYFDVILTTNFDPLLEDALVAARLRRRDYLLLVNGIIRPERIKPLLVDREPRVKIVKLHGDLFHREMAWTPAEMEELQGNIASSLLPVLSGRDLLVVGHSLADSPHIQNLTLEVLKEGGAIWYVNLSHPPEYLANSARVRLLVGEEFAFESFFPALAKALDVEWVEKRMKRAAAASAAQPAPAGELFPPAANFDEFMASVVGIALDGDPAGTGFVLNHPRWIITDTFSMGGDQVFQRSKVAIVAPDQRRLEAKPIRRASSHPFGPWLIEAPGALKAPGLRLDTAPLAPDLAVHVGVAAGQGVGVSSGTLRDTSERDLPFFFGRAQHLVELECVTAPGSAGAPVVDTSFAVRGFIVAGDHKQRSYMYPSYRWAGAVKTPGKRVRRPRTS